MILGANALHQGVTLVLPRCASSALPRGLHTYIYPAVKCLEEGVKVGSQLLASVNRDETIQSLQGEHVPRDVVVSELLDPFKRLKELLAPVFFTL